MRAPKRSRRVDVGAHPIGAEPVLGPGRTEALGRMQLEDVLRMRREHGARSAATTSARISSSPISADRSRARRDKTKTTALTSPARADR